MHEVRFCRLDEGDKLARFIDRDWRAGHALARSRELLDWQHRNEADGRYNFAVAEGDDGEFCAALGFIPTWQFDPELRSGAIHAWLAIWKLSDRVEAPGLGLRQLYFLLAELQPASLAAIGINSTVARIYDAMKWRLGRLDHFYLPDPGRDDFATCIPPADRPRDLPPADAELVEVSSPAAFADLAAPAQPAKSIGYYVGRFVDHPIYRYRFFAVRRGGANVAGLILRRVEAAGSACLRIVDVAGELSAGGSIARPLVELLRAERAEHVDLMCHGLDATSAGLRPVEEGAIVPNYFEPFERRNAPVDFAVKVDGDYPIFKADGDQDRPSTIPSP